MIVSLPHFTLFVFLPVKGDVDGELDPEDDPNNQGEDEFEEAGDAQPQHRVTEEEEEVGDEEEEPAAPAQHIDTHPGPRQPAVEEELVVSRFLGKNETRECWRDCVGSVWTCVCVQMAGNPDQQEDTLEDQYQEEVEDEVGNTHSQVHILHIDRSNRWERENNKWQQEKTDFTPNSTQICVTGPRPFVFIPYS